MWSFLLIIILAGQADGESIELDVDEEWYNSDTIPTVNLQRIVDELSEKYTWFQYIGNATMECSEGAKQMPTLMMAIEHLHDCLMRHYQECASEYANQTGCEAPDYTAKPCGTVRLGYKGIAPSMGYEPFMDCVWYLEVPEGFFLNLTIDAFYLESSNLNCTYDWVTIHDGHDDNSTVYGKYCGRLDRFTIYGTSRKMMIKAHTDGEIGKIGFRAVYQIVDPDIAATYSEIQRFRFVNDGEFTLYESPVTKYDTHGDSYYYNEWHVRVDFSRRIQMKLEFFGVGRKDAVSVYDGPWTLSHLLEHLYSDYTTGLGGQVFPVSMNVTSSGFQLFLVLRRSQLSSLGEYGTSFNCSWTSDLVLIEELLQRTVSNEDCTGHSEISITDSLFHTIGLPRTAKLKEDNKPIICAWQIQVPDEYIQLDIKWLEVNSPNYDDCIYEGLLIMNGENFGNETGLETERIGPLCYDEPKGIFSPTRKGAHKITSTGRFLLVIYYSYVQYPYYDVSPARGAFQATVYSTPCQGLWQVCSRPHYTNLTSTDNFYSISTNDDSTRRTRNITFACYKSKCCVIQEFPIYQRATFDRCDIEYGRDGLSILSTSEFVTKMVVPYKVSESHIQYSKESPTVAEHFAKPGALMDTWLGTKVFISYQSVSVRASGAFTMSIKPSTCGSYMPNKHINNLLFPPCATAKLPIATGTYTMSYLDPETAPGKYYTFTVRYEDLHCVDMACFEDQMEIQQDLSSFIWTKLPILPMVWETWGMDNVHLNWSRQVIIRRQKTPECVDYLGHCYLYLHFQEHNKSTRETEEFREVRCPQGFEKVRDGCYEVVWASGDIGTVLNISAHAFSANEAHRECEENGGHLIKIDSEEELNAIKLHSFNNWWSKYLRFIPGSKSFFIGLRNQGQKFHWMDGTPVTYMNWGVPSHFNRRPDKTRSSLDWSSTFDQIASPFLRESSKQLNPPLSAGLNCAVMLFDTFTSPFYWYSVPCDQPIEGALPLCETSPTHGWSSKHPRSMGAYLESRFRSGVTYLKLPNHECSLPYFLVGNKCFYVGKSKEPTKRKTPFNDCQNPSIIGKGAVITDKYFDLLAPILDILVKDYVTWGIRVAKNPALKDEDAKKFTWKLVPKNVIKGNINKADWELTPIKDDADFTEATQHNLLGFMCEKNPTVPTDTCKKHQAKCDDQTCILSDQRCDGIKNCNDESDEAYCVTEDICKANAGHRLTLTLEYCFLNCSAPACSCNELYFQCRSGGCIPLSKICNHVNDCLRDSSDEDLCQVIACGDEEARCDNGQCYKTSNRCDYFNDCIDGSDERNCSFVENCNSNNGILCNNGTCVPPSKRNDLIPDCLGPLPQDEIKITSLYNTADHSTGKMVLKPTDQEECKFGQIRCTKYAGRCIDRALTCVYDIDKFGDLAHCRTGSHLSNCAEMNCGSLFKCPNSYCLPIKRVCDRHMDCPYGEDEENCDNYVCPGLFRCRNQNYCIRQDQVCDGHIDCNLHGEDEFLCELKSKPCPSKCTCFGDTMSCINHKLTALPLPRTDELHYNVKGLILRNNLLEVIPAKIAEFTQLYRLDLSHNVLSSITTKYFKDMNVLRELYVDHNKIGGFSENYFIGLSHLTILTLEANRISHISEGAFEGLDSLTHLDLSHQEIRTLDSYHLAGLLNIQTINFSSNHIETLKNFSFGNRRMGSKKAASFTKLKTVDIRVNRISEIEAASFVYLPINVTLLTDKFLLCCYAEHVRDCYPRPDEFSSCYNLIREPQFRLLIWILGLLAVMGNLVVLQQRTKYESETTPSLLVQHLAFADLLMGVYLIIVVSADQYYRGNYTIHADKWRASALCKLAGFLQISSCEMSTFLIMLLALDRVYNLVPGCMSHGIGVRGVRGFIALGWTAASMSSVAPILEFKYFGQDEMGFVRSGTCTTYNIIKGKEKSGWEFSMALFVIFNFSCYLVTCIGFMKAMKAWIQGVDPTLPEFKIPEDLIDATDEEKEIAKEDELIYRENEMIITRRLFLVITTNFVLWLPLIVVGAMALWGYHISTSLSAWISIIIVPLNAAINPYLYTFTVNPVRPPTDDLLRNWIEVDFDDDDEFTTRTMKDTATTAGTDLSNTTKSDGSSTKI